MTGFRPSGRMCAVVMPSVKTPESGDALTKAVEFLEAGAWQQAHEIVQAERSNLAAWLHGIVHTLEGDLDNARYWDRRARRPLPLALSPAGGEWIETAPSPSRRERVGVRVAHVFTHNRARRD